MIKHYRGAWIWYLSRLHPQYLEKLKEQKCQRVYLKVVDGSSFWGFQCSKSIIKKFHDKGIEVYGWGYHYGRPNIEQQKNAVVSALNCGLDGYIFDLEQEIKDRNLHNNVKQLIQAVRPYLQPGTLGYTSFGHPGLHPEIPWKLLDDLCDIALPQMYFEKWGFNRDNRVEVQMAVEAHQRLGLKKPLLPIWGSESDAANPATAATLQQFLRQFPGSSVWRLPNSGEAGKAWELDYSGDALNINGEMPITQKPAKATFRMMLAATPGLVTGNLFLFDETGKQIFDAVAVSGRPGHQSSEDLWTMAQGPIPDLPNLTISTQGVDGIESNDVRGLFFSILPRILEHPSNSEIGRGGFGIYNDAGTPGTAGGIGIINPQTHARFCELMANASRGGLEEIPLKVEYGGRSRELLRPTRAVFRMRLANTAQLVTGNLFLFDAGGRQIFDAVVTSGLAGHQGADDLWVRATGPIPNRIQNGPISINTGGYPSSNPGVQGMFFPIDPLYFKRSSDGFTRSEFGVHFDANVPGSSGCVVIRNKNTFDRFTNIMGQARRAGISRIPLEIDYMGARGLQMIPIGGHQAQGISIHIGVNRVDPGYYDGWDGQLQACENDARAMQKIAAQQGFSPVSLLTDQATSVNVLKQMQDAAQRLQAGDFLLLTYSGHGSQIPDHQGDEADKLDETWVLYDRQLLDDELYNLFSQFAAGVRIVVISDSCFSGTIARVPVNQTVRTMPREIRKRVNLFNQSLYQRIKSATPQMEGQSFGASVIQLSACQENQLSYEDGDQGYFTKALVEVWSNGRFQSNYLQFRREISQKLPEYQSPNYFTVGAPNPEFENQIPFTINPGQQLPPKENNGFEFPVGSDLEPTESWDTWTDTNVCSEQQMAEELSSIY